MIPDYLNEPIDILSDSVLEITEKAAYKAHSGTYVEALWDASPSTILSPLREEVDWQPLELRFHAGDIKFSFDPEVSEVPEYSRASGLDPFYGYQSEPPIAPAFREAKPVGLATSALQSLGVLQALLEFEDRAEEIPDLNRVFCQLWGAHMSEVQNARYLKPELTNRSDLDLIKSLRSKTHQIFGYENEQNYVSVHGGGYTHAALNEKRYVDWHRIFLVMRFIGTNLLVSDPLGKELLWSKNHTLKFGLAAREFPLVTKSPHMPSFYGLNMRPPDLMLSDAMAYAFAYYSSDRILQAVADRNRLAHEKVLLPEDLKLGDITVASIREALRKDRKGIVLSFNQREEPSYDIIHPSDDTVTFMGQVSKLKIPYNISAMRASELVLASKMMKNWAGREAVSIRNIMDMSQTITQLAEDQRITLKQLLVNFLGRHFGTHMWLILKKFRQDVSTAETEFVEFCLNMCGDEAVLLPRELSKRELFWAAICHPAALKEIANLFRRTYSKVVHLYNVPNLPMKSLTANLNDHEELLGIIANIWTNKKTYWFGHYMSRKDQLIEWIKANPRDLSDAGKRKRAQLLRYQWLTKWIPAYSCEITGDFEVWPSITAQKANSILVGTLEAFCRKRKKDALTLNMTAPLKANLVRIDHLYSPRFSFLDLYEAVHKTMKEMSRDIAKTFKNIFEKMEIVPDRDPLGSIWQNALEESILQEASWIERFEGDYTDEQLDSFLGDDDMLGLVSRLDVSAALQGFPYKIESGSLHKQKERSQAEQFTDPVGFDPFSEEDATMDLADDFNMDFGENDGDDLPMDAFAETSMEHYRSPTAELFEKKGKLPNLLVWAELSRVSVEKLNKCRQEEFESIMGVGLSMFTQGEEIMEEAEEADDYDVQ